MSSHVQDESWKRIERLEELVEEMSVQLEKLREEREKKAPLLTDFLKVANFLLSKKNRPRSAWAILKATGITRSSLSQIFYRTHKEMFVAHSVPGYSRKKFWALRNDAMDRIRIMIERERNSRQPLLFDLQEGEFTGIKAVDCCERILRDHDNQPMNALAIAREAIKRGYRGRARGDEDEVLLTTAKSFWAALGRDKRFREVRPLVFALLEENGPTEVSVP